MGLVAGIIKLITERQGQHENSVASMPGDARVTVSELNLDENFLAYYTVSGYGPWTNIRAALPVALKGFRYYESHWSFNGNSCYFTAVCREFPRKG
jgi:hypothetical protein